MWPQTRHRKMVMTELTNPCACSCLVASVVWPTPCDLMDCSPPGSSVHGITPARILEWVAMPSSRDLPHPGVEPASPASSCAAGGFYTAEPPGTKPCPTINSMGPGTECPAGSQLCLCTWRSTWNGTSHSVTICGGNLKLRDAAESCKDTAGISTTSYSKTQTFSTLELYTKLLQKPINICYLLH